MPPAAVVTDSTSYLPPELIERHGIHVVPLYVVFGGDRTVPEVEITDYPAFFEELRSAEKLPTTSQPCVGDFTAAYEPLLAEGRDVVSVHISGGLSGTPEAARQAKEALARDGKGGERIEVVDSTTAAGGLGFMVLAAAKAAGDGASAAEIAAHVARGAQGAAALVRHRHARVPQARRPHRRGERVDRLDAEGEADPHRGERDDPGRARAHLEPDVRAPDRVRARLRRAPAPARGPRSTSTRPTSAPRSWSGARRSSAPRRRSSARSGRSCRLTPGPGCSAWARFPPTSSSRSRAGRGRIPPLVLSVRNIVRIVLVVVCVVARALPAVPAAQADRLDPDLDLPRRGALAGRELPGRGG